LPVDDRKRVFNVQQRNEWPLFMLIAGYPVVLLGYYNTQGAGKRKGGEVEGHE